jgi:hypothetical protein
MKKVVSGGPVREIAFPQAEVRLCPSGCPPAIAG